MLRQDLNSFEPTPDRRPEERTPLGESIANGDEAVRRLDIQQSLNVLEELVLASPRVPFSRRTLVDEDQLLEQLDRIRLNLPTVFREAVQIVSQRREILAEAEQYAREVMAAAERQASQRLDDLGIVRQAEADAQQVKQHIQQECDAVRARTLADLEQWQQAAQQRWEEMRQQTEAECETLRQEADSYAGRVLQGIEQQLGEMLRVVRNGRKSLNPVPEAPGTEGTTRPRESGQPRSALPQPASPPRPERSRRSAG
jgi:hypothetical protein